ncbi:MAG TPA: 1-deoxy-D-xylulose-5-phosphate synthase N-terminal domain-containing protein, partial [Flavobacteriales bacterium]|nr:1-deoxy-D-xylulose-5-phosphate synthase N-terminal domain-containing protein [Flavobacteriales bacterium]
MSTSASPFPLLSAINTPADLRKFSEPQLGRVCQELRNFIIDVVSVKGGHFGAS